jgi:hypothetical protein
MTVTSTPTSSPRTAVREANTRPTEGRSKPTAVNSARIAASAASPPASPSSDATRPRAAASHSTERSTWPPVAPSAAQDRELLHPLGDDDRERVEDRERAHEHGEGRALERRSAEPHEPRDSGSAARAARSRSGPDHRRGSRGGRRWPGGGRPRGRRPDVGRARTSSRRREIWPWGRRTARAVMPPRRRLAARSCTAYDRTLLRGLERAVDLRRRQSLRLAHDQAVGQEHVRSA